MALTTPEVIGTVALVVSIAGYLNNRYGLMADFQKQLGSIDARLAKQELKMDTLWPAVTDAVKAMLKQPIHLRKDDLLERFPNLDIEELKELKNILTLEQIEMLPNVKHLDAEKKLYLVALGLMLGGVCSAMIDKGVRC